MSEYEKNNIINITKLSDKEHKLLQCGWYKYLGKWSFLHGFDCDELSFEDAFKLNELIQGWSGRNE